jgi:SAM-dependent methyltransferase
VGHDFDAESHAALRAAVKSFYERPEIVEMYSEVGLTAPEEALVRRFFPAGMSVLDVATGGGRAAIALAQQGFRVTGIDLSPAMVEQARRQTTRANVHAEFVEGDAEALPFDDASFDAALFAGNSIGHLDADGMRRCAQELARVLRPLGRVIISARTPYAVNSLLPGLVMRSLRRDSRLSRDECFSKGIYVHRPSLPALARLFRQANFEVDAVTSHRAAAADRDPGLLTRWIGGQFFLIAHLEGPIA